MPESEREAATTFDERYPTVARWAETQGWIEFGLIDGMSAFVQALDMGGLCWEGRAEYPSIDAAMADLEQGLAAWVREEGIW